MTESLVIGDTATLPARGLPWPRLRRLGLVGAALAALSGIAWAGHSWWTVGRYIETTDDAYVGGNVTAYAIPAELKSSYGDRPLSFYAFVRLRSPSMN